MSISATSACDLQTDYITIGGLNEVRYGESKKINLTNFLPDYIKSTDTFDLVEVFEFYLNNCFDGNSGLTLSATDITIDKQYATSASN